VVAAGKKRRRKLLYRICIILYLEVMNSSFSDLRREGEGEMVEKWLPSIFG
jgi:hypothetical protein